MNVVPRLLAVPFYRLAARFSARMLASSPVVQSVVLHRSAATGEIDFGRSDIDMLLILDKARAARGAEVAALHHTLCWTQRLNPALQHIDVYDPDGLVSFAHLDTFTASIERRAMLLLRGAPVVMPELPVNRDHALSKFLLWLEWFFPIAVQERNRRNTRKTALECFNAYACAEGLTREPCRTRAEMESLASGIEHDLSPVRLEDSSYAVRFLFELAERLHRSRMPPLRKLERPLIFDALTSPLCLRRKFVVIPRADSELPPETFAPGGFPCTPEILDLFVHGKNAFFDWIVPPELRALRIAPPSPAEYAQTIAYYSHSRFLFLPGFGNSAPPMQSARIAQLRYALDFTARGEIPPPLAEEKIQTLMASGARTIEDYYRAEYEMLRGETNRIADALVNLTDFAPPMQEAQD
ncbi:MAG TPA: hypothetical protein VKR29_12185 [Candidatus Binataceae bacterium]|nr:hypothetical protein [Candidatus Binataceae bacterium]